MNPLDNPRSLSPVHTHRDLPMVKFTYEFDFYRCLAFKPHFYGVAVSELHAGNSRKSEDGRYASLFPSERVSYWADSPSTAAAEVRKYGAGLDLITFHAYDDASSTFPTTDCKEPLVVVDGREFGFADILDKLDEGGSLDGKERSLINRIDEERPDCLMYESHASKGSWNFLFFEKGFAKLSLREVRLRLERRDEATGKRKVSRNRICCADTCDYSPSPKAYGEYFLPIAKTAMDERYLSTEEYRRRSELRWHQPYEI